MTISALIAIFLLFSCQTCWAQSGYNYVRPDLAVAGVSGNTRGGGLVTLPAAYPTAAGGTPTATAAGSTAFSGYTGQQGAGTAYTPNVGGSLVAQTPTTYSGGGVLKRPTATATAPTTRGGATFGIAQAQYGQRVGAQPTATGTGADADYSEGDYSAIPGTPGVDYPVYAQVPRTNFDCAQQPLPGYYADIEAQCQVFHICALNRTYSFLCPNGTIFSQETLVCVWWNQYDCVSAPSLYANNAYIYDYEQGGSAGGGGVAVGAQAQAQSNLGGTGYGLRNQLTANTQRTPSVTGGAISAYTPARGYTPTPTASNAASGAQQFGAVIRPVPSVVTPIGTTGGGAYAQPATQIGPQVVGRGGALTQQVSATNREYLPPNSAGRRTA